jgi:putative methionine-R-sulfoxide reductase with GAF domain
MAVGNGDFKKEINVFDNKGDLGNSLVDMRKSLSKVSEERLLQKKKDDQRLWTNEGLAIFADLLRKEHGSIKDMCYEIISKLIKYINANQGYIFLKNSINKETILDLQAAFAYDRRKFADRKIKLGEGLVGSCAIEMETIYMTDIPENYINITSGLGYSNPRTLLIIPLKIENELIGIIELASFEILPPYKVKFIEKVAESIASHIANIQINLKTNKLLEQTKKQAQELSEKEEEMIQNMEELKIIQERMTDREEELLNRIEELENS